jgi:hypothetical protein
MPVGRKEGNLGGLEAGGNHRPAEGAGHIVAPIGNRLYRRLLTGLACVHAQRLMSLYIKKIKKTSSI